MHDHDDPAQADAPRSAPPAQRAASAPAATVEEARRARRAGAGAVTRPARGAGDAVDARALEEAVRETLEYLQDCADAGSEEWRDACDDNPLRHEGRPVPGLERARWRVGRAGKRPAMRLDAGSRRTLALLRFRADGVWEAAIAGRAARKPLVSRDVPLRPARAARPAERPGGSAEERLFALADRLADER